MRVRVWIALGAIVLGAVSCGTNAEPTRISDRGSGGGGCHPDYSGCVPDDGYDLDCDDIGHGVSVSGGDEYGLDRDGDGYGCESYG